MSEKIKGGAKIGNQLIEEQSQPNASVSKTFGVKDSASSPPSAIADNTTALEKFRIAEVKQRSDSPQDQINRANYAQRSASSELHSLGNIPMEAPSVGAPSRLLADMLKAETSAFEKLENKLNSISNLLVSEEYLQKLEIELFKNCAGSLEIGQQSDKVLQLNQKSDIEQISVASKYTKFYIKSETLTTRAFHNLGKFVREKYFKEQGSLKLNYQQLYKLANTSTFLLARAEGIFRKDKTSDNYQSFLRAANSCLKAGINANLDQTIGTAVFHQIRAHLEFHEVNIPAWTDVELTEKVNVSGLNQLELDKKNQKGKKPSIAEKKTLRQLKDLQEAELDSSDNEITAANIDLPTRNVLIEDDMIPENGWQRVISKIPAKFETQARASEESSKPGDRLEAEVWRLCGRHLTMINQPIFDKDRKLIGEIDAKRTKIGNHTVFFEATTAKTGKNKQINKYMSRDEFKDHGQIVIFYAPNYTDEKDLNIFKRNNVVHVRNPEEYFTLLHTLQHNETPPT